MVTDWHTDTQTKMQHNDPASQRTGLGKNGTVKIIQYNTRGVPCSARVPSVRHKFCIQLLFSSNLSNPSTGGGINWSVCSSNSLGTSHSRQGRDDSSSSSPVGVPYTGMRWLLLLLYCCSALYRDEMTLPPPQFSLSLSLSLSVNWGGVRYFSSSLFCDKMITSGWILEFKVSIQLY